VRRQLRAALQARNRRRFWLSPPVWAGAAAAAGIAVVALVLTRPPATDGPVGETPWSRPVGRRLGSEVERAHRRLFELPLRPAAVTLTVVGEPDDLRLRVDARARYQVVAQQAGNLLLLEEREDGSIAVLFPSDAQPFSRVAPGDTVDIPPAGQPGLSLTAPAGPRRLRLALLPVDLDPLSLETSQLQLFQDRIGLVEQRYLVLP
jgi:hypothetical protein